MVASGAAKSGRADPLPSRRSKTIGRVARCELRPLRLRYEYESRQGCERPGCADRRGAEAPRNAADVVTRARSPRRLSVRHLRRPDRRRPRHLRLATLSRLPQRSAPGLGAPDEDAAAGRKRSSALLVSHEAAGGARIKRAVLLVRVHRKREQQRQSRHGHDDVREREGVHDGVD